MPLLSPIRLLRVGQPLGKAFPCFGHGEAVSKDRLRLGAASDAYRRRYGINQRIVAIHLS